LPDGRRLLAVHVAPGRDDGSGLDPVVSDEELGAQVASADADVVCVGHTHWPIDRTVGGVRVINPGSVSNPLAMDLRASYAMLDCSPTSLAVEHYRVAYDL
jgi:putative phosphoesterase